MTRGMLAYNDYCDLMPGQRKPYWSDLEHAERLAWEGVAARAMERVTVSEAMLNDEQRKLSDRAKESHVKSEQGEKRRRV